MMHVTMILCDTILIATMEKGGMWYVTCTDAHSGKTECGRWTQEQMNAITILAMAGDEDLIRPIQDKLYSIAETALVGWEPTVRPIP